VGETLDNGALALDLRLGSALFFVLGKRTKAARGGEALSEGRASGGELAAEVGFAS
jgi:hypothetical protein